MNYFIYAFSLVSALCWLGKIFANDNYSGIVFMRNKESIVVLHYTNFPYNKKENRNGEIEYTTNLCSSIYFGELKLLECINALNFDIIFPNVPKKEIFFKVFYSLEIQQKYSPVEIDSMIKEDERAAKGFMYIKEVKQVEFYNPKWRDFLTFSFVLFEYKDNKLIPACSMIYSADKLFFGFITANPKNFSTKLTYEIHNTSHHYPIVANTFMCASPQEINYLIMKQLIHDFPQNKEISHPCLPEKTRVTLDPSKVKSKCVNDFGISHSVDFSGMFDESGCKILLKMASTQSGLDMEKDKAGNFAGLKLPLQIDKYDTLHLYTSFLDTGTKIPLSLAISLKQYISCHSKDHILYIEISNVDCLSYVYLDYILKEVAEFSLHWVQIISIANDSIEMSKVLYSDPRIAYEANFETGSSIIPIISIETLTTTETVTLEITSTTSVRAVALLKTHKIVSYTKTVNIAMGILAGFVAVSIACVNILLYLRLTQ